MLTMKNYRESAAYLREKIGDFVPEVMIVLGSGLGYLADTCEDGIRIAYSQIPYFKIPSVTGHAGELVFGTLSGKKVCLMNGRIHIYEGNTPEESAYAIRVLRLLGCKTIIMTNAAGGICEEFRPGDIMLIKDHIKFFPQTPLEGPNLDEFGPRFPDMTYPYCPELQDLARKSAKQIGLDLKEGVYFYAPGPQYETPAEIRAMRLLGGDSVGMSTVCENIAAVHCGMEVLAFSVITDMAAGILKKGITHEEIMAVADAAKEKFCKLILKCVENL